jgi:hypothetical protein
MWYIYTNGNTTQPFKEGNSIICNKMDELKQHYAKQNKPGTKRKVSHNLTYM